jgi:hypothetical protein
MVHKATVEPGIGHYEQSILGIDGVWWVEVEEIRTIQERNMNMMWPVSNYGETKSTIRPQQSITYGNKTLRPGKFLAKNPHRDCSPTIAGPNR